MIKTGTLLRSGKSNSLYHTLGFDIYVQKLDGLIIRGKHTSPCTWFSVNFGLYFDYCYNNVYIYIYIYIPLGNWLQQTIA